MADVVSLKHTLLSNRNSVKPRGNVLETRDLTCKIAVYLSTEYICGFRMFHRIKCDYFRAQF